MILRTFASVFPRQSPSSLIFSSMNAEADSIGTGPFLYSSNSATNLAALSGTRNPRKIRPDLVTRSRLLMSNPLLLTSAFLVTDPTTGNPRLQLGSRTHNLSSNLLWGDLSIDTEL